MIRSRTRKAKMAYKDKVEEEFRTMNIKDGPFNMSGPWLVPMTPSNLHLLIP